jgi:predicted RNA-binding Zn-ribbon protein involved in translation (DUF1610 family)
VKYREYNVPTPTPEIGSHARATENITIRKEPLMPEEDFCEWISQHIEFHTEEYKAVQELGYSGEPFDFRVIQPRTFQEVRYECVSCSLEIPKRRPVFALNVEAFGQDGFYLCPSCFPQLIEECDKSREQLRNEIKVKNE